MVFSGVRLERAVMDVGTAILGIIGGEHFGPFAAGGQCHLVVGPCLAGEVDHHGQRLALGSDAQEAQRVVIGIVAGEPLETGRIEVLAPQSFLPG